MRKIEKHPAGAFCWVELATSDQNAAKTFYSALFGWSVVDAPMGPDDFYTMFKLHDRDAGAAYTLRPEQRTQGVPPNWITYIAVDDADETARRAGELGATVLAQPFDVFEVGRMAVIQDPTGAVFCLWQAKCNSGLGIAGVDGTFCWADLSTPDPERAGRFYSDLFGWKTIRDEHDPSGYIHIKNGEEFIGGIPPGKRRNPNVPPHWMIYFQTSNCDATARKAEQLGGTLVLPPVSMENVGRMAIVADPQGATFSVFQSERK